MAVILRSRTVLPINAPPIEDGAVVVQENTIVAVPLGVPEKIP